MPRPCLVLLWLMSVGAAGPALAQTPSGDSQALEQIRAELAALRRENQELRQRVDALSAQGAAQTMVKTLPPAAEPEPPRRKVDYGPILYPTDQGDPYATPQPVESYAAFAPGRGYKLADTEYGELNISAYSLARYINQLPADDLSFTDHLGRERPIDPRADIQWQRVMVWLNGWAFDPKLRYQTIFWTVNSTNQVAIAGALTYHFNDAIEIGTGINRLPGTYTMMGSHPYWYAPDRVMADEFFRPGMTGGIWVTGEPIERVHYFAMLGNNLSELGINAAKLTRNKAYGVGLWWMPTTGEFGPRGGMGDYEHHTEMATRFGVNYTHSREDRFSQANISSPDNTQIRLSDSTLLFETGALAPGVTVIEADWDLFAASAGFKYRGWALHAEAYYRHLGEFDADGPLPLTQVEDTGFYLLGSYEVLPRKLQLYVGTSQVFGQFNDSSEYLVGLNWYPWRTRNVKINGMVIRVIDSPVSSLFGYYVGGQNGTTITVSADVLY